MYFFKFKMNGWEDTVGEYEDEGLIYGENFTEAVDNLENYYGNNINSLYIEAIGDKGELYLFDKQYKINEKEVVTNDAH